MQLYLLAVFLPMVLCASPHWRRFCPESLQSLTSGRRKLVVGLDGTLFPLGTGLQESHNKAVRAYFREVLKVKESDIELQMYGYMTKYGSIPNGLVKEYKINPKDYEAFLDERIDYECIPHDQALVSMLERLSVDTDIAIFTDAGPLHTNRIIAKLGIAKLVHTIFSSIPGEIEFPLKEASTRDALARVESFLDADPSLIYYVEGSLNRYLHIAKDRNCNPIKIDRYCQTGICGRSNFLTIRTIHDLPKVFEPVITPDKE